MGQLPSKRAQPSRPFLISGVDFAGPITTLVNKGRGRKTNKSYIALFICFATRAIHLEVVSELSTDAFMATLRRFIGRRGNPSHIYSDNATNFVGTKGELDELQHLYNSPEHNKTIGEFLAGEHIEWKFIPPGAPHMAGFWEAGVKSCKYHLKRIMGNSLLTYEELSTLLCQIEACLNSRPLYPLSSDPADLSPLTPGHFLIGEPLTSIPDIDLTSININRLSRWQMIQRHLQEFWKRWSTEYINTLQVKSKWKVQRENLKINDLVVIRDENLPPLKWKMGRVLELHPGQDESVRVVTLKTATNVMKRPIAKLCKLPMADEATIDIL